MKKKVAIIAAMPEEVKAIRQKMKVSEERKIYDLKFYEGKIGNTECVLAKCGVGKVNAARVTQILMDYYSLDHVINIGSAGSIKEEVHYGDIVIGKYVLQHDFDITAFGHEKGYISNIGTKLESDKTLIQKCEDTIHQIMDTEYKIVVGTVATGDIFCTSIKMKDKIRTKFDADCVEMEGAAIAQVCYLNQIPFVIIRSISDSPNEENHKEFNEYLEMASARCSNFIEKLLY